MRSITQLLRPLSIAACAGAIAATASGPVAAQDDSSAKRSGMTPSQSARAKGQPETAKAPAEAEQQALRNSHEEAITQARGLQQLASQEKEPLDHQDVLLRVELIGQALENSRQHLASIEALSPTNEKTRKRFDEIREKQDDASEHQRELVQQVDEGGLDMAQMAKIEHEAKEVVSDMKKAESERQKLPGGAVPDPNDNSSRQPG